MGNGGERDGASAKSVARKPQGCYGAEPYQKLSSVPRPNYVFCIIGKKRQRQARKVNIVCHAANRSRLLSQILLFLKKCVHISSTTLI